MKNTKEKEKHVKKFLLAMVLGDWIGEASLRVF
jgi:hypothetical protein